MIQSATRRTMWLALSSFLLLAVSFSTGCSLLRSKPSPLMYTGWGKVELDDYATWRRITVVQHEAQRDKEGRLVVKVTWLNTKTKPYRAQVRVEFLDENGMAEMDSYRWHVYTFQPGEQETQWTSHTMDAASYVIEVREDDAVLF